MTLAEQVKQASVDFHAQRSDDVKLRELTEFYREKQQEGIALKRGYDLPPIDTIGRSAFRNW